MKEKIFKNNSFSIFSFVDALSKITEANDAKNLKRKHPYPWLSPRIVPNSISI